MELLTPEVGLFFWSALVFLVLLGLLSQFAWKPIMAGLKEREENIEQALKAAEEAKAEMARLTAQNENLLAEARIKRDELIKDAQKQAADLIETARAEASKKAAADLEAARQLIQTEREKALAEIKNVAAELSLSVAEKLVHRQLANDATQQELVKTLLAEYGVN